MTFVIPYKSLVAWGYSSKKFAIEYKVVPLPEEMMGEQHTTYVDEYYSQKGKDINDILKAYYGFPYCKKK